MKITNTRRSDYGLRACIHLAGVAPDSAKAAEIAEEMVIPLGFLHQVLKALQRDGLLVSKTGPNGGYSLSRPPEQISLLNVIEALEGPLGIGECGLRGGPCRWDDVCALHEVWSACRTAFCDRLAASTLADLARADEHLRAGSQPIPADTHRGRHE